MPDFFLLPCESECGHETACYELWEVIDGVCYIRSVVAGDSPEVLAELCF